MAGLYLAGAGDLTVGAAEGEPEGTANITVTGNYDVPVSADKPVAKVVGLAFEADGPIQNEQAIVIFNTQTTNIQASATSKNLLPIGLYMMNGSHLPVIEFHGDETTIAAENVGNAAIGVRIVQDDLTGDPKFHLLGRPRSQEHRNDDHGRRFQGDWYLDHGRQHGQCRGRLTVTVAGDNHASGLGAKRKPAPNPRGLTRCSGAL